MTERNWTPCQAQTFDYHAGYEKALKDTAAPELYDALENLLKCHEGEGGTKYHAGDIARAALAKARGEDA